MKKTFTSLILALTLTVFTAGAALAQQVIIANGCDFALHGLALVQTGQEEGDNLLSEPLASGDGLRIDLNINKGIDLIAVDDEGNSVTFQDLDLSSASKVTLHSDGTASIE